MKSYIIVCLTGDNKEHISEYHVEASSSRNALMDFMKRYAFASALAREIQVREYDLPVSVGVNVCRSDVCGYCELPGHNSSNCPDKR